MPKDRRRILRVESRRYRQLAAARPLVQDMLDEQLALDDVADLVLGLGLERILTDIIGGAPQDTLVEAQLLMADENPNFVYSFTRESLRRGTEVRTEAAQAREVGFVAAWRRRRERPERQEA